MEALAYNLLEAAYRACDNQAGEATANRAVGDPADPVATHMARFGIDPMTAMRVGVRHGKEPIAFAAGILTALHLATVSANEQAEREEAA